ncbi:sterol carrier protein [Haloglomus irregulare]|jgi:putative sterol carrier protein|uniref:Sterol carrier protein n=1 Tax=Haloglomus irregulare TaxID=2234134 RepID=A0A554NF23_9EURY|nr:SCP2 sterol-binding domain-containing protein [Haloglomus irregulare]TSD15997.1 sterol carrier protein [Haloglomus irregulare]
MADEIDFPSEEWFEEYERRVNESEQYSESGAGWGVEFNGDFLYVYEADDRLPETRHFFVGLHDGGVTDTHEVDDPDEVDAGFALRGAYTDWIDLNEGDIGAVDGMMSGVFELEGDMQKVMQYTQASVDLTEIASEIPTNYKY